MPVLCPIFKDDEALIELIASSVCDYWNDNGGVDHGIRLFYSTDAIKALSRDGDLVLSAFFPEEPGPFKRLATLLVLARLAPIFHLASPNSTVDNIKAVNADLHDHWISRVCYLLIAPTFASLSVDDGSGTYSHALDQWTDFPSLHSKTEFLFWLEWLCDYDDEYFSSGFAEGEKLVRRGRMILATALIIEQAYYNSKPNNICGICDKALIDSLPNSLLYFDAYLQYNKQHPDRKGDSKSTWLSDNN